MKILILLYVIHPRLSFDYLYFTKKNLLRYSFLFFLTEKFQKFHVIGKFNRVHVIGEFNYEECFKKLLGYWYCVFYQGFLSIHIHFWIWNTTHKMKFSLKSFFSKCEKIRGKKSLTWNTSFFCTVEIIKLTFVWNIWFE